MLQEIQSRSTLLLGKESMHKLSTCRVIVFGVGGVGSWAAETLVRTGLKHITIVDSDEVAPSNINRQLMANTSTIGKAKVEALKKHLLLVNPEVEVTAIKGIYSAETAEQFHLETYDYIIDCIDSLEHKVELILHATSLKCEFYASMGAALKIDPTKVSVAEFWKVKGCPLAAALRRRIKKGGRMPRRKFKCVYSEELLKNAPEVETFTGGTWDDKKAQINGSLMHITALFGMTLAGLVIQSMYKK
ncbi:MAG: tRNA threonylcarbamoyladenosine dehydratase [Bacteroidaceae bacterium]|nr:tRNA threonylcarbamoyladenosine dehydratase [Bacteroidaceae bacterium]